MTRDPTKDKLKVDRKYLHNFGYNGLGSRIGNFQKLFFKKDNCRRMGKEKNVVQERNYRWQI